MTATDADRAKAAEVTREDRAVAMGLVRRARAANSDDEVDAIRDRIAREIATERTAARAAAVADLRARVEAVAEELEADSERAYQRSCGHRDEGSDGQYRAYEDAAERLRAAVTHTTGDPA